MAASPVLTTKTRANDQGLWRAEVRFTHLLSESDTRDEYNLSVQWPRIRRVARNAIVASIAMREQKTTETLAAARRRVRASLGRLAVIEQGINGGNAWYAVTLGERA